MTNEKNTIIEMAKKLGADVNMHGPDETTDRISMHPSQLERFYAIAAASRDTEIADKNVEINRLNRLVTYWRDLAHKYIPANAP